MDPSVKPPVKPLLSGYKLIVGYIVGGIVITATVIVVAINWNSWFNKPAPAVETQATTPAPANPLAQFNGSYTGTSNANAGISSATVNIATGVISGSANYTGSSGTKVVLTVTGTVDASGNVTGNLAGTGTSGGESAAVTGTYSGTITNGSMSVKYSGSGGGESASGTIVLTKK